MRAAPRSRVRLAAWTAAAFGAWAAGCAHEASRPTLPAGDLQVMNPIERILHDDPRLAPYAAAAERYRLQVVLGLVEEDADGEPRLVQHDFRADAEYFYPASAIKLAAAVAALERLAELARETGLAIDAGARLVVHPAGGGEPEEAGTVAELVRAIFVVSDNAAYNRLFELVGPRGIERSMRRAGLASARVRHRLYETRPLSESARLPAIELVGEGFRHRIPERAIELEPVAGPPVLLGDGYLESGELVLEPMDFRAKNRMSLPDLQRALVKVVRPEVDAGGPGFRLDGEARALLVQAMRLLPREAGYDFGEFPDSYVKLFLPGLRRAFAPERLEVANKVGRAYGFSVENAYVVDRASGRGFFLAAAIYANRNRVLNDDRYEYEEVADPFLADLGEAVARAVW